MVDFVAVYRNDDIIDRYTRDAKRLSNFSSDLVARGLVT